jgi:short-subunit dehydrogenase
MKKAIIIGATSGIGRRLAQLLVKNQYIVGITGRRKELLDQLKLESPDSYYSKTLDVTDTVKSVIILNELVKEIGGLDLLIICSGTGDLNDRLDFEIEKRTIQTNVIGFTFISDWAFNYFQTQGEGHLVGISSIGGLRGSRQGPSYNASKAYQINYLEALRQKSAYLKLPIYITDIRPGFVDTAMAKGEGKFWVSTVDKAANQIMDAIKSKKNIAYVSKRWKFIAVVLKNIPNFLYDKM